MRKSLFAAAAVLALLATPAFAEDMMTSTPELSLPEPDAVTTVLPQSSVTESEALALPEPETEAAAPFKRCGDRETVYLTN
jgi:hypothetical protein